jgi:phenylalanyl-tRNA synthetase alpha subunit
MIKHVQAVQSKISRQKQTVNNLLTNIRKQKQIVNRDIKVPTNADQITDSSTNQIKDASCLAGDTSAPRDSKPSTNTFTSNETFPSALHFLAEIASDSDLKFVKNGFQVSHSKKSNESEEYKKEEQPTNTKQVVFNQKVVINQNHPTLYVSDPSPNSLLMPVHSLPQVIPNQPQNVAPQFDVSTSNPKIVIPIQSQHQLLPVQPPVTQQIQF